MEDHQLMQKIIREIEQTKRDLSNIKSQKEMFEKRLSELEGQKKEAEKCISKYECITSSPIRASSYNFSFESPGREYCVGTFQIPMTEFRQKRCLDFTPWVQDLWTNSQYNFCKNIMERVTECFKNRWAEIRTYDSFIFPIDLKKKAEGKRADLPNVAYAITMLMHKYGVEFVIVDPIHNGTDKSVRAVNFSEVLRYIQYKHNYRCLVPQVEYSDSNTYSMVFYQRGDGSYDEITQNAIQEAVKRVSDQAAPIVQVKLTPGKYVGGHRSWGNCYSGFTSSAAQICHELSVVDEWVKRSGKQYINKIFFAFDEFPAYAAFTATAIVGYGIEKSSVVLARHRGSYTPM